MAPTRNLANLADDALLAELNRRREVREAQEKGAQTERAAAMELVGETLLKGADLHPSKNDKAWFGAYVKTGEFTVDGVTYTASITFTDVERSKAMRESKATRSA